MSDIREVKIRQLLLREFRANRTVDQAYKTLRFIFGPLSITRDAVSNWFKNFKNGQTKIFADNFNEANLDLISDEIFEKNSKAMLVHLDKEGKCRSIAIDGRMQYTLEYDQKYHQPAFVVTDLFHGKSKSIFFPDFSSGRLKIIDDERFLLFDYSSSRLHLLKLNYVSWTIEVLHSVATRPRRIFDFLILDQQNSQNFILIGVSRMMKGQIQGDQIVLEASQHDNNFGALNGSCYTKLDGNKLCILKQGIDRERPERHLMERVRQQLIEIHHQVMQELLENQQQQGNVPIVRPMTGWRYCEIDLATSIENSDEVQMVYANSGEAILGAESQMLDRIYEWVGNRLYTVCSSSRAQKKIIAFDADTRLWFDVGISFLGSIENIHIDFDQHLTVKTLDPDSNKVFYRFALKEPDKLSNIAFLAMARKFKWDAPQTYEQMIQYVPLNNSLQCQVPVENVDDQEEVNY